MLQRESARSWELPKSTRGASSFSWSSLTLQKKNRSLIWGCSRSKPPKKKHGMKFAWALALYYIIYLQPFAKHQNPWIFTYQSCRFWAGHNSAVQHPFAKSIQGLSWIIQSHLAVLKPHGFYSRASRTWYEKNRHEISGFSGYKSSTWRARAKLPNFFCCFPSNMIRMTTASSSWTRLPAVSNPSSGEAVNNVQPRSRGKFQLSFRPTTRCSTASSSCNCSFQHDVFHVFFSRFLSS